MNSKNIFKMGAVVFVLSLMLSSFVLAGTRYVNSSNGDDLLNNGLAPTQTAVGVGPYKTIAVAITAAADGDVISIAAGAYAELGAAITVNKSVTLISTTFLSSNIATITNGLIINGAAKTINLGRTADGSLQFDLGTTATALALTAGTLNVDANTTIGSGATITRTNGVLSGSFTTTNVNVTYGGATANVTAGTELPLSLGTGSLTVSNTGFTVTFPNAITTSGSITLTVGGATFNGNVTVNTGSLTNSGAGTLRIVGNVAMNGLVAVTSGSILNTAAGTLQIDGTVTNDALVGNIPGVIWNTNLGTLTVGGLATWKMYGTNFGATAIANTNGGAGTVTLSGGVSFTKVAGTAAAAGAANATAAIINSGSGTMTIASLAVVSGAAPTTVYTPVVSVTNSTTGTLAISGTAAVTGTAVNTAAGTLTFGGSAAIAGTLTNTGTGTINLTGGTTTGAVANDGGGNIVILANTTFAGNVSNNNAASVIKLNANTLTLSAVGGTVTNAGNIISTSAAAAGSGVLSLSGGATINSGGGIPNVTVGATSVIGAVTTIWGNLTITAGTLTINDAGNASSTVKGNIALNGGGLTLGTAGVNTDGSYTQPGGTLTFGARTMAVKGNVTMTSGSVVPGTGTLSFVSGTAGQSFTMLPNFALNNMTITSPGQVVTLAASVMILNNVTIASGSLDLGMNNLRMQGAAGTFTNTGGYTSTGGGTLIFEGTGGNPTITGAGVFSNIDIRLGSANYVTMGSAVTVSGIVYLRSGDIDLNSKALTLNSTLVRPAIYKNTLPGSGTAKIVDLGAGGTVSVTTDYDLTYYGGANWPGASFGSEWVAAKLHNLTVGTGDAGNAYTVTPPAGAVTITGNLTVNSNQTLSLAAAGTLTASAASAAHSIVGAITNGALVVSGNSATVTGVSGAVAVEFASVNDLTLTGTGIGVTNLKIVSGNLAISGAGANVTMNTTSGVVTGNITVAMTLVTDAATVNIASTTSTHSGNLVVTNGALTYTRGAAAQQNIGGTVTLTAGSLTLGSSVNVTGATSIVAGNLIMGAFNYTQKGSVASPDFIRTGAGTVTGTGTLVFDATAAAIDVTPGTTFAPVNVTFIGAANGVTLNAAMAISGTIVNTSGITTLGGDLTWSGSTFTFTAGSFATTGGGFVITGATPTITAAAAMSVAGGITVNSTGVLKLRSSAEATPTPRTFTSTGAFTQTAGDVDLGINTLAVTGASFTRTAGNWAMGTGVLTLNSAAIAFAPGVGMSVKNLTISNTMTLGGTNAFTVTGGLSLANALTLGTDALLTIGDGATITMTAAAAVLDKLPAFPASNNYNVVYNAAMTTGKELGAVVNNLTTTLAVTLNAAETVNGTLAIGGGTLLNATAKNVTFGAGGILEMDAAGALTIAIIPPASGVLNIVYNGVTATSSFDWPAPPTAVGSVTIKAATQLHADRTVQGTLTLNGGSLDLGLAAAHTLTVQGDVVVAKTGNFFASTTAGSYVAFAGATNTAFTLVDNPTAVPVNVNIKINKTNSTNMVTLGGGSLNFATNSATLYFANGLLATGTNVITLKQSVSGGQPVQGFDRSAITGTNESHVFGNVRKFIDITAPIAISRVEFPTGSSVTAPFYRPFVTYFKTTPQNSINMTVNHVDTRANGSTGFPIAVTGGQPITNYPNFYWFVQSDISLNPSYQFDMEAQAKGYSDYVASDITNIRFVRRDSGNVANKWILQASVNGVYDNSTLYGLVWPAVKVIDATGGITSQGSIFTYSQSNKPPIFTAAPGNMKSTEADTLKVTFTSVDPDLNQTSTLSLVAAPTGATLVGGLLTWPIGYDAVTAAQGTKTYSFTVRATDNSGLAAFRDTTFIDTVYNKVRPPQFVAKPATFSVKDSTNSLSYTYTATDVDGNAVTFSLAAGSPTGMSMTAVGLLTWTPTFVQSSAAGIAYPIKVYVADAYNGKDSATAVVTVIRKRLKGDINADGVAGGTADATIALRAAVGLKTFTMPADTIDYWAGDVSGVNGVGAYDAALMLTKLSGDNTVVFAPKIAQAFSGSVEFGSAVSGGNSVSIPVKVTNAENVTAITFTVNVDAKTATYEGTSTSLPKDWIVATSNVDGVVTVAMAGLTPVNSGNVASVNISLKDKAAQISLSGSGFVNEAASQTLSLENVRLIPSEYALDQNYPNPFNPSTTIKYQLTQDSKVNLTIYNLQGQVVRTLVNDNVAAGFQSISWNGKNEMGQTVATGMYVYRIQAGSFVSVKKMLMLK
jgi:FlgD Ig-like domain